VTNDLVREEDIFDLHAVANIVNDLSSGTQRRFLIADQANVRDTAPEVPGNDVSGMVIRCVLGDQELFAGTPEIGHEVGYTPVIDILVRRAQTPPLGICRKVGPNVFVYQPLEIDAVDAEGTDEDISADTGLEIDITIRIRNAFVAAAVVSCDPNLGEGRFLQQEIRLAKQRRLQEKQEKGA
jgi:hypothetical protein